MTSTRPRIALVRSGKMGSLHARVLAQSSLCDLALLVEPRADSKTTQRILARTSQDLRR